MPRGNCKLGPTFDVADGDAGRTAMPESPKSARFALIFRTVGGVRSVAALARRGLGVILYIDRVCIAIALPAVQKELDLRPEQLGWIGLAFPLAYAVCEIPTGARASSVGACRRT